MDPIAQARRAAVLFVMGAGMGFAQSLPPTRPTAPPTVIATPQQSTTSTPASAGDPARVKYADGKLEVIADNSSLNQILREIGRLTGMTITGGVAEQRVFGSYGPAASGEVLGDLLRGTGSNMLLRETSSAAPAELILSPRQGGVTPPNPNAPGFDGDTRGDDNASPVQLNQPPQSAQPIDRSLFGRAPYVPTASAPPDNLPQAAPASSTNPPTPSGPLTPEQVYQQLQQLQKAQPRP